MPSAVRVPLLFAKRFFESSLSRKQASSMSNFRSGSKKHGSAQPAEEHHDPESLARSCQLAEKMRAATAQLARAGSRGLCSGQLVSLSAGQRSWSAVPGCTHSGSERAAHPTVSLDSASITQRPAASRAAEREVCALPALVLSGSSALHERLPSAFRVASMRCVAWNPLR